MTTIEDKALEFIQTNQTIETLFMNWLKIEDETWLEEYNDIMLK